MADIVLENNYLRVTFPGNKGGFGGIRIKGYTPGSAIVNEYNRLYEDGTLQIMGGDYHSVVVGETEYSSGSVDWITYKTTMNSRSLYGSLDPYGNTDIEVVKVVSGDIIDIGSQREIVEQDLIYFFTPDGKGLLKKVMVRAKKLGSQADTLQSLNFANSVTFSPLSYNFDCRFFSFDEEQLGFDNGVSGWALDSGLTGSDARASLYPNLIPDFNDSGWTMDAGSRDWYDAAQQDLTSGDILRICYHNAIPQNRKVKFTFTVSSLSGSLDVTFGTNSGALDATGTTLNITSNGTYSIEVISGYGNNWLFVKLNQLSGSCRISNLCAYYLLSTSYVSPDGSSLANTNLRNCLRLQSSNPSTKRMTYNFGSNVFIGEGKGVKCSILSLDNISITDGAFKFIFQKPDNSWVSSEDVNMFIDYNDTYPKGTWDRFNMWSDSFVAVKIPDGVDEIKAIGIEFITTSAINWLFDGFGIVRWQDFDIGVSGKKSRRFGLAPGSTRAAPSFSLCGVQGVFHNVSNNITGERISVVVVGGASPYGENIPLTLQNVSSVSKVWQIAQGYTDVGWGSLTDKGYEISYNLSVISNLLYPVSVQNLTTGDSYSILKFDAGVVYADIAEQNYSTTDTVRITYDYKDIVSGSHYSLAYSSTSGKWGIKWVYDSWTAAHDREPVWVDYVVPARTDDDIQCLVGGSVANTVRVVQQYPSINSSPALLSIFEVMTFADQANEWADGLFVYQPMLNKYADRYSEARSLSDVMDDLVRKSKVDVFTPMPLNWNLIPHVAFGGEYIAANPIDFLNTMNQRFAEAGCANAVMSVGGLGWKRDRDMDSWWWWSWALADSGIDMILATRQMLNQHLTPEQVANEINSHRYMCELVIANYGHVKRHPAHASEDYKGNIAYLRIWYYQESTTGNDLYTATARAFDDFDAGYYDDVVIDAVNYEFQYHYIAAIPAAFWSAMTPRTDWPISEETIYDQTIDRLTYLCQKYDTDAVIISELIYYRHSYTTNDLSLYNDWRVNIKGWATVPDWPRDAGTGYVDVDDTNIWDWKCWQVEQYLTNLAAIAHNNNTLLGINVQVQNIIPIAFPNAPVWSGYTKLAGPYGTCVDTFDYSVRRYGTDYTALLKSNIVDFFWVWLYWRYSAFGKQAAYDFMDYYKDYKDRMILVIGLFPKDLPPSEAEVVELLRYALKEGWHVCYAGYPPMLFQDSRFQGVWEKLAGYVPKMAYNGTEIEINPYKAKHLPFMARF